MFYQRLLYKVVPRYKLLYNPIKYRYIYHKSKREIRVIAFSQDAAEVIVGGPLRKGLSGGQQMLGAVGAWCDQFWCILRILDQYNYWINIAITQVDKYNYWIIG